MNDEKKGALILLRGSVQRLLMVLNAESTHNYDLAINAVEKAIADYRKIKP